MRMDFKELEELRQIALRIVELTSADGMDPRKVKTAIVMMGEVFKRGGK